MNKYVQMLLDSKEFQAEVKIIKRGSHPVGCDPEGCPCLEQLWNIAHDVLPVRPTYWGNEESMKADAAIHEAYRLLSK